MSLDVQLHRTLEGFTLDVAFQVPASGVTALFGPSGAGKTSVLRAVAGLDRELLGWVRIDGESWLDRDVFVAPHRRAVGYVFQEDSLFEHLDVAGNIDFAFRRRGGRDGPSREELVALLGLGGLLSRRGGTLSGGERRRVAIARALATAPRLLLLDEPLTGLDPARRAEVLPYLEGLARTLGLPVLLVSHRLGEVARLADHLVLLEGGRVRASGPLNTVLADLSLPLAQDEGAAALLVGQVEAIDDRWGLATVRCGETRLLLPADDLAVGRELRLRVAARDVSIVRRRPEHTSILNILPVTVGDRRAAGALVTLELSLPGGGALLARITARSEKELDLVPGSRVFAQVKGVAVLA